MTDGTTYEVRIPVPASPDAAYEAATTEEALAYYQAGFENVTLTADSYGASSADALEALFAYGAKEVVLESDIAATPASEVGDDSLTPQFVITEDMTLDLNGKTFSVNAQEDYSYP